MKRYFNKETIIRFYKFIRDVNFESLSDDDFERLDKAVEYWRYFFTNGTTGLLPAMSLTAERMITSNGRHEAKTWEEKAYFYIKTIDPNFMFLEAYESGNTIDEIKQLCYLNFHLYDSFLISLEKKLYKRLNLQEDLWPRELIKTK